MSTSGPNLDQRRARSAWAAVQKIKSDRKRADDYAREAKKMPVRILTSGLGQALAFVFAKSGHGKKAPALKQLEGDLDDWVLRGRKIAGQKKTLRESICEGDAAFLRQVTDEALAYLQWINRFAEGEGLGQGEAS